MSFFFGKAFNGASVKNTLYDHLHGSVDPTDLAELRTVLRQTVGGKTVGEHVTDLFRNHYKTMGKSNSNIPSSLPDSAMMLFLAQLLCRQDQEYNVDSLTDAELQEAIGTYCTAKEGESFAPSNYSHLGNAPSSRARGNGTGYSVYVNKSGKQTVSSNRAAMERALAGPGMLTSASRAAGAATEEAKGLFGTVKGYFGMGGVRRKTRKQKKTKKSRKVRKGRKGTSRK